MANQSFGTTQITKINPDFQERGIKTARDEFLAINGSAVKFFKTIGGAIRWLKAQGYDAHGKKI